MPQNRAYEYEYFGGQARLAPRPKMYRAMLDLRSYTQMTLALATSLVECGGVDAGHVSAKYAEFYEGFRLPC